LAFLPRLFLSLFLFFSLDAPKIAAARTYASIVMDAASGNVLHEVNADETVFPASLTKMMTLYLTFQALDQKKLSLNQLLSVSRHAQQQKPTKLGLKKGEKIAVKQAILGVVTKSANDAAVVLAEKLAKTEAQFAAMMTRAAKKVGLRSPPSKMPPGYLMRSKKQRFVTWLF